MMKIFGAALIVSSGYLVGLLRTNYLKKQGVLLADLRALLGEYDRDLRNSRRSFAESLEGKGELAEELLRNGFINDLRIYDQSELKTLISQLKTGAYDDARQFLNKTLSSLDEAHKKLKGEIATIGKNLPLITGAAGVLVAVLLF